MSNETPEERANRLRTLINKAAGKEISYNLTKRNPTKVKTWISTGSRWLDSIIATTEYTGGRPAGLPAGRLVEIAGENSAGKSYMAVQLAKRAQDLGFMVVWQDSEFQLNPDFLVQVGLDVEKLIYIEAESIENVMETTEVLLEQDEMPKFFVLDSVAACPTKNAIAGGFSPTETVAEKARILSLAFSKLTIPLGRHGSIFLALNQLKTKIAKNQVERIDAMIDPFTTPGGKSLSYHASLRIWLTKKAGKNHFIYDEDGEKIGATIKALVKKSRFGSEGRAAEFQIFWRGGEIRIADEESWFEALKASRTEKFKSGAWCSLFMKNGEEVKFRSKEWMDKLKEKDFRERVIELLNECLIKT